MSFLIIGILLGCFGIYSCQKPKSELPESCNLAFGSITDCLNKIEKDAIEIDLSYRQLSYLPDGAFSKFVNLKIIDLSHNNFRSISAEVFLGLTELHTLKLNNNQLEALSGTQLSWTTLLGHLATVHLSMNPFICNCSITWLRDFLSTEESVVDSLNVKCLEPLQWNDLLVKDIPSHYDSVCKGANFAQQFCGAISKFPCTTTEPVNVCIPKQKLCDGVNDCSNNLDESPYVCNGRQPYSEPVADVIPVKRPPFLTLFNGLLDRYHVQNVQNLANAPTNVLMIPALTSTLSPTFSSVGKPCRYGAFKCYSNTCIPQKAICDGKLDCSDGADEDVVMCASRMATSKFPAISAVPLPPDTTSLLDAVAKKMDALRANWTISDSPRLFFQIQNEDTSVTKFTTLAPMSDFLANLLSNLNVSLSQRKITELSAETQTDSVTEGFRHPTITFPQMNGNEYLNHLMENSPSFTTEAMTTVTVPLTTESPTPLSSSENTILADFNSHSVPDKDVYQPQNIRLVNLKNNEISILWDGPSSARAGNWRLVAYSVICEVIRIGPPSKKKKFSPLLSTLVHDYQFHHILPDDSLTIVVKALYEDSDHQRYESISDPYIRPGFEATKSPVQVKKEAVAAAQNVNYPGKMGFEDLVGISIGGTLVGLMIALLAIYFYKRRNSNSSHVTLRKVHKRTMRMRKLDRTTHRGNDRTFSMEPIYSEPEYAQQALTQLPNSAGISDNKIVEARNDPIALKVQKLTPDNHYIQVLETDSQYYACSSHPPGCSEYSCYSLAAAKAYALPAAKPCSQISSDCSSYAVYDSDNCSVGYYFHNTGVIPPCAHTPVALNVKHFGDTLTMCHGSSAPLSQLVSVSRHPDVIGQQKNVLYQENPPIRAAVRNCESENSA